VKLHSETLGKAGELRELNRLLDGREHLLIIIHNTPDPDAIASAAALAFLAEKRTGTQSSIAYGGIIGRAENREMIRRLNIQMKQISRISFRKYDCVALVDTQPGSGNNSLPPGVAWQIVIDHHPRRSNLRNGFVRIEPEIGATSTLLVECLQESQIDIPADLATALAFAITSETQNLLRETTRRDIDAYMFVYQRSNIRKLAQIASPRLRHPYFEALSKTLSRARIYRNVICAHIGKIPTPETVSEMANFLLRHERVGWCLCSGHFRNRLILSLRSSKPNAKANELIKALVPGMNTVGGHDMSAGGYIPLHEGKNQEFMELEIRLLRDFAFLLGYRNANWKPLLETRESPQ
jgi:nanoRNase/pAp phosphatase (c-di-AMP/oligoRNAs hydrolase)